MLTLDGAYFEDIEMCLEPKGNFCCSIAEVDVHSIPEYTSLLLSGVSAMLLR